jgi:hypothetical protein
MYIFQFFLQHIIHFIDGQTIKVQWHLFEIQFVVIVVAAPQHSASQHKAK